MSNQCRSQVWHSLRSTSEERTCENTDQNSSTNRAANSEPIGYNERLMKKQGGDLESTGCQEAYACVSWLISWPRKKLIKNF
ncbi:hypothetical protein RISK_001628 [Rhodopirellula islandica]|uniref:Uncharacterized protein n=1 Tax=Rhodopirellula islandica TaxID=595434 RepID=A0A0J1BIQ8_RHOIS|nr:hypothetical protein RISK_001628 [Rhodopirellula islandica]